MGGPAGAALVAAGAVRPSAGHLSPNHRRAPDLVLPTGGLALDAPRPGHIFAARIGSKRAVDAGPWRCLVSNSDETGQITGTKDKDYNIIWFTEVCLSNVLRLETYAADA